MRLLFITQKVDKEDDILGVYHQWIEELAVKMEKLTVVCLYRGRVELPSNVRVYSLGKERIASRFLYLIKFYFYLWKSCGEYDAVFVHMNPEYILLGGAFWKLFRKKIFLWYNHPLGNWRVWLAAKFCQKVFCTSPFAFAANLEHSQIMPVGIDIKKFRNLEVKKSKNSILYLGRISPIKNIEYLIKAAKILKDRGIDFSLKIVGSPARPEDFTYEKQIRESAMDLGEIISFSSAVPNYEAPEIYNNYEIAVNLTDTGSLDKAMLEAMACENLVLVSNKALQVVLPPKCFFEEKNSSDLADKLEELLKLSQEKKTEWGRNFRQYVINNHDLFKLADRLILEIQSIDSRNQ